MHAYVFSKEFQPELDQNIVHPTLDRHGRPRRMVYLNQTIIREYSVLVGNFQSPDDNDLQSALAAVRRISPTSLTNTDVENTGRSWFTSNNQRGNGPLAAAFPVPNPLLPADFFGARGVVDPFVVRLNADSQWNLLDNPGKYTLKVATFTGRIEIRQDVVQRIQDGREEWDDGGGSALEQAGQLAMLLTHALRQRGFEAWEFHDRESSIVTIGTFNHNMITQQDGSVILNPAIAHWIPYFMARQTHQAAQALDHNTARLPLQRMQFVGIPFDIMPTVIEVPRRPR